MPQENRQNSAILSNFLRWIIFFGAGLSLFTPFIISARYFFPFVGPKSIYFMALAEIIFTSWLILIVINPKYRPRLNALLLALVFFLAVSILSSIFGVDFSRSFWSKYERMTGILMQLHLFGFFLAISSVFKSKEDWLKIFGISVFAAILMSGIFFIFKTGWAALFSKFGLETLTQIEPISRGGATIGNSSFLGTYLLFNVFLAIYLCFNLKSTLRILSIFGLLVIGLALFFSTAQAATLSAVGGLVLLFFLWLIFTKKGQLRIIGASLLVILIILSSVSIFFITKTDSFIYKSVFERFLGQTFGGRFVVWEDAWKGFSDRPLLGWGLENFEIAFTKNYPSCLGSSNCGGDIWYDRAHNIVFDTLVATGILGLLSYFGIFAASFWSLGRQFLNKNINFWTGGIFSVVLISYFLQNLTVFDMINSYVMLFLMLGFISSISQKNSYYSVDVKEHINLPLIAAVLVLFVSAFYGFVVQSVKADRNVISAISVPPGSPIRLDFYKKTFEANPIGKYQIRDFFVQTDIEFIQSESASKVSPDLLKKELDFIISEMEKSVIESPLDFRSFLKLGQAYNVYTIFTSISKLPQAEETLKRAIELSPSNQQGYWSLAQAKVYSGKPEEALSLAEKALNLEPKQRQAHLIVIQVAKIMGNRDLAKQKYDEAVKVNPSWEADLKLFLD